jgi:uncharacterized protein YoxC
MALLSELNTITGENSACSILEVPVAAMRSAADALDDMKNNPPDAIQTLARELQNIETPTIPGVDALTEGIRALRNEIPSDVGELTQPVADAMAEFFDEIRDNFGGKLDDMLGGFAGLGQLGESGFSGPVDGSLSDVLAEMQNMVAAIPNPFTVETLLQWLKNGLDDFPRGIFPYRYFPVIDELKDKLETTLRWSDMNGTELAGEIEQTLISLAESLRGNFIVEPLKPITDDLDRFADSIDAPALTMALDGLQTSMSNVSTAIKSGDLSGSASDIAGLLTYKGVITNSLSAIDAQIPELNGNRNAIVGLPDEMEDRALHFLALMQPPHDLEAIGLLLNPLATAIEDTGISVLLGKVEDFIGSIRGVLNGLNITSFKDDLLAGFQAAEDGIDTLRNMLMQMTITFSALMDRVSDAIEGLGISSIIDAMENGLRSFTSLVQQTANTIFAPVRNFLMGIFQSINGLLAQLDPAAVVATLQGILSKFTDLLSNPQLLDAIDTVKGALDTVNGELGTFTFKPGADVVVTGIDVVEKALQIASALPLPDSLKEELRDALNKLPRSLDPAVDTLVDGLEEIINEGPKPFLLQVKTGPQKLVDIISEYSPEKLVNECLGTTFQDMLTEMGRFEPSALLVPIQQALDVVKEEVRRIGDPVDILSPLNAPFDELLGLLDDFDPEEIIAPLSDALQDGIQAILEVLPIGAANAIFDQIAGVATTIQGVHDGLDEIHTFADVLRTRMNGLANARQQMQNLGNDIAARINTVSDMTGINAAMAGVGTALSEINGPALKGIVDTSVNALSGELNGLDLPTKLASIASALQVFPVTQLNNLPASLAQTNIQSFLTGFDPTGAAMAAPAEFVGKFPGQLQTSKAGFDSLMAEWNSRYLEPTGPIMQLHQPGLTLVGLQTMLSDTIENQLTETLEPVMQVVEHLQEGLDGIVTQIAGLVSDLNDILADILDITDALEELRVALNKLVEALLNFDLNFVAEGFQQVFDTLISELGALAPSHIAAILAQAFDDLLEILDIEKLIGAGALDAEYAEIVENLRALDPGKIIVEVLQPEFEKVLEFILRFDLSIQIDDFLVNIERLVADLRTELDRVADKYEVMWNAIPSSVGGVTGVSVSITITAST